MQSSMTDIAARLQVSAVKRDGHSCKATGQYSQATGQCSQATGECSQACLTLTTVAVWVIVNRQFKFISILVQALTSRSYLPIASTFVASGWTTIVSRRSCADSTTPSPLTIIMTDSGCTGRTSATRRSIARVSTARTSRRL